MAAVVDTESMFPVEVLKNMKESVKDPLKRKLLSKDETFVGGLVLVLSNEDSRVVITALEILLSLAEVASSRNFLNNFIGMQEQIQMLTADTNALDYVQQLAGQLRLKLRAKPEPRMEPRAVVPPPAAGMTERDPNTSANVSRKRQERSFLSANKYGKTVTLQIRGLTDRSDMECCRTALLTVRGVISITFDMKLKRAIVRVKQDISPQLLGQAIASSNSMLAEQVVRGGSGEGERLVPFDPIGTPAAASTENMPKYLSDDEDLPAEVRDKAVRKHGERDGEEGGWISTAASFLSRSFYW